MTLEKKIIIYRHIRGVVQQESLSFEQIYDKKGNKRMCNLVITLITVNSVTTSAVVCSEDHWSMAFFEQMDYYGASGGRREWESNQDKKKKKSIV